MLGGVIVGLWGFQAAYLIDVVAFSGSLYAMWRLPSMRPDQGRDRGGGPPYWTACAFSPPGRICG